LGDCSTPAKLQPRPGALLGHCARSRALGLEGPGVLRRGPQTPLFFVPNRLPRPPPGAAPGAAARPIKDCFFNSVGTCVLCRVNLWAVGRLHVELPPDEDREPPDPDGVPRVLLEGLLLPLQVAAPVLRVVTDPRLAPRPCQSLLGGLLGGQGQDGVARVHPNDVLVVPAPGVLFPQQELRESLKSH
jgi:hypothetical protein